MAIYLVSIVEVETNLYLLLVYKVSVVVNFKT